jgi:hypothetical protein
MDPVRTPVRHARATHAITVRWYGHDSPEAEETARNLNAANAEAYIQEILDKAPPLTDEQRAKLAELLKPVRVRPGEPAGGNAA